MVALQKGVHTVALTCQGYDVYIGEQLAWSRNSGHQQPCKWPLTPGTKSAYWEEGLL